MVALSARVLMGVAVAVAVVTAGATLDDNPGPPTPTPYSPTPAPTATPAPSAPRPAPDPAGTVAEAYALAATNWTNRSYVRSLNDRARLAAGRLKSSLRGPTSLGQLERDRVARLGAVLSRRSTVTGSQALVRLAVDEVHLEIGGRSRQVVAYEVRLRRQAGRWKVIGFTAAGGRA